MRIHTSKNKHGVKVAHFICQECMRDFSITPAPDNDDVWKFCYDKECFSYDPKLEVSLPRLMEGGNG